MSICWWISTRRGDTLLDHERVQRRLTEILGVAVDVAVRPLRKQQFKDRVEQKLVRAF
jgi:predicted nucleotidyltransferase